MSYRITMVVGSLSRRGGGVFQSLRQLSLALLARGHHVRVVGLRDPDTEADLDQWTPLRPIVLDTRGSPSLGYVRNLSAFLMDSDIVHQHGIWQLFSYPISQLAKGKPTIISPHGMLDPWARNNSFVRKRVAWYGWERENLRRAAYIHALAEAEALAIRDWLPNARILVLPNGIVTDHFLATKAGISSGIRTCLFMARIHPKKGLHRLLNQWAELPLDIRKCWRLKIAGPDEVGIVAQLKRQVEELSLRMEVEFVGALTGSDKINALNQASAFVLPSYSEGLPMSVLEAWAAGLPVLMTRACNLPEGFVCDAAHEISDDPGDLARGLARSDLEAMGQRGRELVEKHFSWDKIAESYEVSCDWILNQDTTPPPFFRS